MKISVAFSRIFLALILGFLLGITIRSTYELTARQPHKWKYKPAIINCAGKDINKQTIERAINFWISKKEEIYFFEYDSNLKICKNIELVDGFIIIKTQTDEILEKEVLASTKRKSKLNIIQSAVITFKPGTHNFELLLEHELGHAFGYRHRKIPGHIMHPYYDMMGDKFW